MISDSSLTPRLDFSFFSLDDHLSANSDDCLSCIKYLGVSRSPSAPFGALSPLLALGVKNVVTGKPTGALAATKKSRRRLP